MAEAQVNANKKLADKVANVDQDAREQADKNKITSRYGKTETVKIDEGTDNEQTYLFQFPGTVRASDMLEAARNPFGNINRTYLMQEAVKNVIVAPKIKDLAWFDTHHGYSQLYDEVYSFLEKGLN